jgi:spore coat protein CotF
MITSLLGGEDTKQLNDPTIVSNMLGEAKAGATAYLTAILGATTPELRAIYSSSLTQILGGHSALTALAINKEWYKPYELAEHQLAETLQHSEKLMNLVKTDA